MEACNYMNLMLDSGSPSLYNTMIRKKKTGGIMGSFLKDRVNDTFEFLETETYKAYKAAYIDFLLRNHQYFDVYVNLDIINNAQATWDNQLELESYGLKPIPVFHFGSDMKWLYMLLEKGYKYIAMGGFIPNPVSVLQPVLDDLWSNVLCDKDGMPKVKVHGFAVTSARLVVRYPWWSTDSVAGDSLLLIKEAGRIRVETIEELYYGTLDKKEVLKYGHERKALQDVEIFVPDIEGKGFWTPAAGVIRHAVGKKRYLVRTKRGREIHVTGDHGVFVQKEGKISCIPTTDLIVKEDQIVGVDYQELFSDRRSIVIETERIFFTRNNGKKTALKKNFPIRIDLDNRFLEFLGLWVADGSYRADGLSGRVTLSVGNDPECYALVREIAERYKSSFSINKDNNVDMYIQSPLLSRVVKHLGFNKGSKIKEVPWWVFELSREGIGAFLRGYFSGDGTVKQVSLWWPMLFIID